MASRIHSPSGPPPRTGSLGRGFATVDPERQREVASGGGHSAPDPAAGRTAEPGLRRGKADRAGQPAAAVDRRGSGRAGS